MLDCFSHNVCFTLAVISTLIGSLVWHLSNISAKLHFSRASCVGHSNTLPIARDWLALSILALQSSERDTGSCKDSHLSESTCHAALLSLGWHSHCHSSLSSADLVRSLSVASHDNRWTWPIYWTVGPCGPVGSRQAYGCNKRISGCSPSVARPDRHWWQSVRRLNLP